MTRIWLKDYTAVFSKLSKDEINNLIHSGQRVPAENVFGRPIKLLPDQIDSVEVNNG